MGNYSEVSNKIFVNMQRELSMKIEDTIRRYHKYIRSCLITGNVLFDL